MALELTMPENKLANRLKEPKARDWHAQRNDMEPRAAADQWRTRDRLTVMFISEMDDKHLGHCIRFAMTKPQHASRLQQLLNERSVRDNWNQDDG